MSLPLPPPELRWGGPRYREDEIYIRSGISNARTLELECAMSRESRILDIGCGQGRLLNGLVAHFGSIRRYVGIDVHEPSIRWLQENVTPTAPYAEFLHVAYRNERYNPTGTVKRLNIDLREKFDCIALFSVFSHMRLADISNYLTFMRSTLYNSGRVYLTAFVEDDVEAETENPEAYHRNWSGALHCVRLNRQEFERRVCDSGFQVKMFRYRHTNDGQSSYVLSVKGVAFVAQVVK